MKTKLEVGKEYWLSAQKISRGIYLGESNSGNFDFRITLGSKCTKPFGELDVMTSNLSVYSEYIPETPWQFTTPIAMKCTEEQFNGIDDKLAEMGYEHPFICLVSSDSYLCSGYKDDSTIITSANFKSMIESKLNRIIFTSFNPDLFLALAAMTDKEDGIKGEWWVGVSNGTLFEQSFEKNLNATGVFRKATAQEIIEHFERKEFLLQPRWYVELTESNRDIVIPWHKSIDKCSGRAYDIGAYYGIFESGAGDAWSSRELASQYQIITNDQFKKYVLKETEQSCQVIPIPPTKQATLFDDRVEITDWKPKDGDFVFYVAYWNDEFRYTNTFYNDNFKKELKNGFIKRTESEAKQLVEKLKQAML